MEIAAASMRCADANPTGGAQLALLASGLFVTVGLYATSIVLPQIGLAFATTPHGELLTQLVGAIASFSFAIGAPLAGLLIARFGCRRVLAPALVLFAVAGLAPMALDSLWAILATRLVVGLAVAGIFTAGLTGIGDYPENLRARMFGWYSVAGGAAALLLFPAVGALARYGWRLAFLVHLIALMVLPLTLFLPRDLGIAREPASKAAAGASQPRLLTGPMLRLLGIAAVAGMGMILGAMYAPIYLSSLGVTDTRLLAVPITLGSVASVAASGCYGWLHRLLGIRGVSAAGMIIWGAALLLAGTAGSIPLFTNGVVIACAAIAAVAPNVSAAAVLIADPAITARALGTVSGVMFGVQLLFPFIAGWIRQQAGIAAVFLAFGMIGLAIGAGLVATAKRRTG
jgi:MFS family permease